ncbi:MAG: VCBS repeat-containing protein [Deltaproteobacteria bacterium]|nr:VCBS repeat-containing protein [Deltaproteobacteria bacterium]MBI3390126.1 VCBS repeat-containing protein [Deltaproteobacteria bacterium]
MSFAPPVSYPTGMSPKGVAVGDFDGDGVRDLATANSSAGTVSILAGSVDGTFSPVVATLTAGAGPAAIAAGDLNDDGLDDLVIANLTAGTVAVFVATGQGFIFSPSATLTLSGAKPAPVALTLGAFDNDATLDIAVVNAGASRIELFTGNGDGTFTVGQQLFFVQDVVAISTGDLNGDSNPDLVAARTTPGTAAVFLNSSDGFHAFGNIGAVAAPSAIAAADVNDDGFADLLVTGRTDNRLVVLSGNGDGTFNPPVQFIVGATPRAVAIGDFNNDGLPDAATADQGGGALSILRGANTGTFAPAQTFSVGGAPVALAVADFNFDGYLDVVTANQTSNAVSVLLNLTGNVTPPPTPTPEAGPEIIIGSDVASPGAAAQIVVSLQRHGTEVTAVQNDIRFDTDAFVLSTDDCVVNPATGKNLRKNLVTDNLGRTSLRAIVLSFTNADVIPDGPLYTCTFTARTTALGGVYPLIARAAVASAASGDSIPDLTTVDGAIIVDAATRTPSATRTRTPTHTITPTPTRTSTVTSSATPSSTPTITQSRTSTPTGSHTATPTASPTVTATATPSPSAADTATASSTPSLTASATPTWTTSPTASASPTLTNTPPLCVCDCDHDGAVTVDELIRAVNIGLGTADLNLCPAADADHMNDVTIEEIVQGVNNSLNDCPK